MCSISGQREEDELLFECKISFPEYWSPIIFRFSINIYLDIL